MIISHKHKFIFIKPHKTAGTSVELLLSRICGPDDVITPLGYDPDPNVRKKHGATEPQNYKRPKPFKYWEMRELFWLLAKGKKPHLNYWEHLRADGIREYCGEEIWNSYTKISIVRNPWDHAVSMYEWMARYGFGGVKKGEFDDFVRYRYMEQWPFFTIRNVYAIDIMLQFESLNQGLDQLAVRIPELASLSLPVTKNKVRTESNYQNLYTLRTREIIRDKNLNVIERFHYNF